MIGVLVPEPLCCADEATGGHLAGSGERGVGTSSGACGMATAQGLPAEPPAEQVCAPVW